MPYLIWHVTPNQSFVQGLLISLCRSTFAEYPSCFNRIGAMDWAA